MHRHILKLNDKAFDMVVEGKKIYEMRLYDERMHNISIGDVIVFLKQDTNKHCEVKVLDLLFYENFAQLYRRRPLERCGYDQETINLATALDMDRVYSKEDQKKYAACAIKFELLADGKSSRK